MDSKAVCSIESGLAVDSSERASLLRVQRLHDIHGNFLKRCNRRAIPPYLCFPVHLHPLPTYRAAPFWDKRKLVASLIVIITAERENRSVRRAPSQAALAASSYGPLFHTIRKQSAMTEVLWLLGWAPKFHTPERGPVWSIANAGSCESENSTVYNSQVRTWWMIIAIRSQKKWLYLIMFNNYRVIL